MVRRRSSASRPLCDGKSRHFPRPQAGDRCKYLRRRVWLAMCASVWARPHKEFLRPTVRWSGDTVRRKGRDGGAGAVNCRMHRDSRTWVASRGRTAVAAARAMADVRQRPRSQFIHLGRQDAGRQQAQLELENVSVIQSVDKRYAAEAVYTYTGPYTKQCISRFLQ